MEILPAVNRYRNMMVENELKRRDEYYEALNKCITPEEGNTGGDPLRPYSIYQGYSGGNLLSFTPRKGGGALFS